MHDAVALGQTVRYRGHWLRKTGGYGAGATWEVIHPGAYSDRTQGYRLASPYPSEAIMTHAQIAERGLGQGATSGDVSGGGSDISGGTDSGGVSAGGAVDQGGGGGTAAATGTNAASGGGGGGGGGAPAPQPTTAPTTTPMNWTPWIIGGAVTVAAGAIGYSMWHRGKHRR